MYNVKGNTIVICNQVCVCLCVMSFLDWKQHRFSSSIGVHITPIGFLLLYNYSLVLNLILVSVSHILVSQPIEDHIKHEFVPKLWLILKPSLLKWIYSGLLYNYDYINK